MVLAEIDGLFEMSEVFVELIEIDGLFEMTGLRVGVTGRDGLFDTAGVFVVLGDDVKRVDEVESDDEQQKICVVDSRESLYIHPYESPFKEHDGPFTISHPVAILVHIASRFV